jgi:hypothetical protein
MNAILNETITLANASLRDEQKGDGHFVYENPITRLVFRGCFIFVITAIRGFSR